MKKFIVPALMLALIACGGNNTSKKASKEKTETTQAHADSGCTEDHSKETAEKTACADSGCTEDHSKETAEKTACADSGCTEDHSKEAKTEGEHKHTEACNHEGEAATEHKHTEACNHEAEGKHVHGANCNHDNSLEIDGFEPKILEIKSDNEEHGHPDANFTEVSLKPSQAEQAKIKTFEVQAVNFAPILKVSGRISAAPQEKKLVIAPISGVISFRTSSMVDGAAVSQGKTYVQISTANIDGGDYLMKAKSRYESAKSDFERAERLIKDKLISAQEYNSIKLNFQTVDAEYKAVKGKEMQGGIGVTSPMSGFINEVLIADGAYVEAGTPLFSVTKNKNMVLTAYISERYYNRVSRVNTATFKTNYNDKVYDLKNMKGQLLAYGKGENDNSYLVPVSFAFEKDETIFPGSYVDVYLKENTKRESFVVPIEAITEEQGVFYVYTYRGALLFRKIEVKLGDSDGRYVQVLSGVKSGDRVVFNGTYQIKLAASSGAIPAACGHAH